MEFCLKILGISAGVCTTAFAEIARKPKFIRLEQKRKVEGRERIHRRCTMSDQTHLLERIMGLQVELNHFGKRYRQQQIRHDAELNRLRSDNRNLQTRLTTLQADNNTLRVQLRLLFR